MNGVVAAYLGAGYALYRLEHNVELQERLLKRLKDIGQFQGAYYELLVASVLIRAGLKLTLEDETDGKNKHCEFAAISGTTGKRYWVEAKMRSVAGLLGKTSADGCADDKLLARLIPHLNDALIKPAADDRLIFIDVNSSTKMIGEKPDWMEPAMRRLEQFDKKDNTAGAKAMIFVTNVAYHRELDKPPAAAASPLVSVCQTSTGQVWCGSLTHIAQKRDTFEQGEIGLDLFRAGRPGVEASRSAIPLGRRKHWIKVKNRKHTCTSELMDLAQLN